jgi:hypothetical protein
MQQTNKYGYTYNLGPYLPIKFLRTVYLYIRAVRYCKGLGIFDNILNLVDAFSPFIHDAA